MHFLSWSYYDLFTARKIATAYAIRGSPYLQTLNNIYSLKQFRKLTLLKAQISKVNKNGYLYE